MQRLNAVQRFLKVPRRATIGTGNLAGVGQLCAVDRWRRAGPGGGADRLLERLFHNGLRPEQDLPAFLRFSGQPTSHASGRCGSG